MQKIKFIGYSNTLFQNKILEETIFYFANKSGFKIEKLEYNFVDLNAMRSLNVDFLSHDNHTDIVTFDYSEEKNLIAEVYISLSMMRENAKKYKPLPRAVLLPRRSCYFSRFGAHGFCITWPSHFAL